MSNNIDLSERESEILRMVATGASNKEIAQRLVISPNTVKVHLRNIFAKIGVISRTEATLYAIRAGLVEAAPENQSTQGIDSSVRAEDRSFAALLARQKWAFAVLGGLLLLLILTFVFFGNSIRSLMIPSSRLPEPTSVARWQQNTALPEGRKGMAVAAYENMLYLFGGETKQGVTSSSLKYDPADSRWIKIPDKPTPSSDTLAALVGGKIFIPGGRLADGKTGDMLEIFNPRQNHWETGASLPEPISGYALTAFEGKIYLFGGWNGSKPINHVYVYDPADDDWTQRSDLPSARAYAGAAVAGDKIYIVGGFDGSHALSDLLAYYPQRENSGESPWEKLAPLPHARYAMSVSGLADMIYVFGGISDETSPEMLPPVHYMPQSDQWLSFTFPPLQIGAFPGASPLESYIHIFGGKNKGDFSAAHLSYKAIYTILIPVIQ
jgi:DNA-binding CsgD family transcriptional regulator/N-acetylneuraminic acid mutarotase